VQSRDGGLVRTVEHGREASLVALAEPLEAAHEQLVLVAERRVDATPPETGRGSNVVEARTRVASRAELLLDRAKCGCCVEAPRSTHASDCIAFSAIRPRMR